MADIDRELVSLRQARDGLRAQLAALHPTNIYASRYGAGRPQKEPVHA
jgi:hypothetical protein